MAHKAFLKFCSHWCEHLENLILCRIIYTGFPSLEVSLSMLWPQEMLLCRFFFQRWWAQDLCENESLLFGRTGSFWLAFLPSCDAELVLANLISYAAQGELNWATHFLTYFYRQGKHSQNFLLRSVMTEVGKTPALYLRSIGIKWCHLRTH